MAGDYDLSALEGLDQDSSDAERAEAGHRLVLDNVEGLAAVIRRVAAEED